MKKSSTGHQVASRDEWLAARTELLKAEKELTRRSDQVAKQREELPWVRIDKAYRFETNSFSLRFGFTLTLPAGWKHHNTPQYHPWAEHANAFARPCWIQIQTPGRTRRLPQQASAGFWFRPHTQVAAIPGCHPGFACPSWPNGAVTTPEAAHFCLRRCEQYRKDIAALTALAEQARKTSAANAGGLKRIEAARSLAAKWSPNFI